MADSSQDIKPKAQKINIKAVHEGKELKFYIKTTVSIKKIMDKVSETWDMDLRTLKFTFDGLRLRYDDGATPESLGMEDDDQIDVFLAQEGGRW